MYKMVPLSRLTIDRIPLCPQTLDLAIKYREKRAHGIPPVHVMLAENGRWQILDGRHRYAARKLAGYTDIFAKWTRGK